MSDHTECAATKVVKPWTIKSVPVPAREAATQAALEARLTVGQWIARAIETYLDQPPERETSQPVARHADIAMVQTAAMLCDCVADLAKALKGRCEQA